LRNRNGDIAAALKARMEAFPGETEKTAVARATLIKTAIEKQMANFQNINE
jgi:hypothetical protein